MVRKEIERQWCLIEMKIIFSLVFTLLLVSCNKGDDMNKIEALSSNIASSTTDIEEEHALETLWEYIYKQRIYVEIISIDSGGNERDINDVEDLSNIVKVRAIFSKNSQSYPLEWKPINLDNVFILFREK